FCIPSDSFYLLSFFCFLFLLIRPPPISTLFPYTTLFRSTSVKPEFDVFLNPPQLIPVRVRWQNYVDIFVQTAYARQYLNKDVDRSEEHTSELQSRSDLVCRLLLEKKKPSLTQYRPFFTQI